MGSRTQRQHHPSQQPASVDDVRLPHAKEGVWCISINETLDEDDEDIDKSLKNEFSTREVPVHPELHKLGFLTYVEKRRKAGKSRLFDASPARNYDSFGKWFNDRFLKSIKVKTPRLVFHSFRHNFEQAMLEAIPDYALRWQLTGRTDSHSSAEYRGKGYSIATRAEAVAKIVYPGLDLSRLYP